MLQAAKIYSQCKKIVYIGFKKNLYKVCINVCWFSCALRAYLQIRTWWFPWQSRKYNKKCKGRIVGRHKMKLERRVKHKRRVIVISSCDSFLFHSLTRAETFKTSFSKMNDSITIVVRADISNISRSRFPLSRITRQSQFTFSSIDSSFEKRSHYRSAVGQRNEGSVAKIKFLSITKRF